MDCGGLVTFLREQKAKGRKAWQRLQIVRALEYYRNAILRTWDPDLSDIRDTLTRAAEHQRSTDPPPLGEIDVVGKIDANEPEPNQALRREMRRRHRSLKTEKAYVLHAKQRS